MIDEYRTNITLLPAHMRAPMLRYLEHGYEPGDFLRAVLTNDFMGAVGRADSANQYALRDYAVYLYSYAPQGCYGSPERYAEWVAKGGLGMPVSVHPGAK